MNNLTLVVLAAGMGTRFGDRIKQLEPLGPNGEPLIDYSVYDAVRAGFDRVVFIIRKDIEQLFKSTIGDRISKYVRTEYVFQSTDILPCRAEDFPERTRPWGTAQALYCCKDIITNGAFAIVNADDFYGAEAFAQLAEFLKNPNADGCSIGFLLKNTLSDHGSVNRGICKSDENGLLTEVRETKGIERKSCGDITGTYKGEERVLADNDTVSMSMWGFGKEFMPVLEKRLTEFVNSLPTGEAKAELTIADAVGAELSRTDFTMRNIPTNSEWFGITYESDVAQARETLKEKIADGVYPRALWEK
jgi:NDP-sugar pyrophosphorylase family protein